MPEAVKTNADGSTTWPDGVEVTMNLTADGEAVSGKTAKLTADQTSYTFEGLDKYQEDGETEIAYSVEEVKVDGYTSEVGELSDGKITVTNVEDEVETVEITVEKAWENLDGSTTWPDGVEVKMQLTADGEAVEGKTTTLSASKTSYTFETLPKYQEDGETEIAYSVEEVKVDGYTSEVGELSDGKITVTNKEDEPGTAKGEFQLKATKTLKGRKLKADEFSFELKDSDGKVIETKKNAASGEIAFSTISVDDTVFEEGKTEAVKEYTVKEVIPSSKEDGMTYDTRTFTATVTLTNNGDGTISASIAWKADKKDVKAANFENSYSEVLIPVKTGDSSSPMLYIMMMILAMFGLVMAVTEYGWRRKVRK